MNISLPEKLKRFVDRRVKAGGYGSHSEYLRELVRKDEEAASVQALRELIREGLESAPGPTWEELKRELTGKPLRKKAQRR
ncbi:MAG: type II toxin-antitoxin system ParD family antitoxin [Myxococcota bacterium]